MCLPSVVLASKNQNQESICRGITAKSLNRFSRVIYDRPILHSCTYPGPTPKQFLTIITDNVLPRIIGHSFYLLNNANCCKLSCRPTLCLNLHECRQWMTIFLTGGGELLPNFSVSFPSLLSVPSFAVSPFLFPSCFPFLLRGLIPKSNSTHLIK